MSFEFIGFITDPFVLMFLAISSGLAIGKVQIGRFNLGTSGGMFTGLLIGWYAYKNFALPYKGMENAPKYAALMLEKGVVSKDFFTFTLILFVAAVGLLASKDLGVVVKKYGMKFIVLGFVVTSAGALATWFAAKLIPGQNPFTAAGIYTGALTSSPGLAAALEAVSKLGVEAEAQVGYGYAIGYAPGVLVVIMAMQFFPLIFGINMEEEKKRFRKSMNSVHEESKEEDTDMEDINILAFIFACLLGYFVGSVNIYLGPFIQYFSLGATGGVLITSLVLGHIGKIGFMNFRMNTRVLGAVRELSLSFFLAIVGLRYGYETISSFTGSGAILAFEALICGFVAILSGFLVGRYLFKLDWIVLSGALCGGMTSTPGLGAAIDSAKSDDPAAGYGATYPVALLAMVIFTILLQKLI